MTGFRKASSRPQAGGSSPSGMPPSVSVTPKMEIPSAIHARRPSRLRTRRVAMTATIAGYR